MYVSTPRIAGINKCASGAVRICARVSVTHTHNVVSGVGVGGAWFRALDNVSFRFDLKSKRFTARKGFPFFAKTFSGSFQEMSGLALKTVKNRYGHAVGYSVDLEWNLPERPAFELIRSGNLDKARNLQAEFSQKMGIPAVEEGL